MARSNTQDDKEDEGESVEIPSKVRVRILREVGDVRNGPGVLTLTSNVVLMH